MPPSPERAAPAPPDRRAIAALPQRRLRRGGAWKADVTLVEGAAGPFVVKDFAPRGRLFAATVGRWLCAREVRAYRRLAGIPVVPRLIGRIDGGAFAVEYRPGEPLSRALRGRLPAAFMDELEGGVRAMHARGVVHLDLRHRSNVLGGRDGRPVVIDFASALCLGVGSAPTRWLLGWLARFDERALDKWRARVVPVQSGAGVSSAGAAGTTSAGSRGASRPT